MTFACRSCGAQHRITIADFGVLPISNALVSHDDAGIQDPVYPLHILLCTTCSLVQLADHLPASTHFHSNYVYFSSHSRSWLEHCQRYTEDMIARWSLNTGDQIVEIASNDGYLLQYFNAKGFSTLGIEPSENVAAAAIERGIPTEVEFFGAELARDLESRGVVPSLLIANNVMAHVPDLNDFVNGISILLKDDAVLTAEVHYFRDLFENNQFDAFYHEHYYYYTIRAADLLFRRHGLRLFDIERLTTHGGSLRFYVCRDDAVHPTQQRLRDALDEEEAFLQLILGGIDDFGERIHTVCEDIKTFLEQAATDGQRVVGYGAPAKATTILNLAQITPTLLPFTVDSNPHKQNRLLPGVRIPILAPEVLQDCGADTIAILAWNLRDEIIRSCREDLGWTGNFVVFVPKLEHFGT